MHESRICERTYTHERLPCWLQETLREGKNPSQIRLQRALVVDEQRLAASACSCLRGKSNGCIFPGFLHCFWTGHLYRWWAMLLWAKRLAASKQFHEILNGQQVFCCIDHHWSIWFYMYASEKKEPSLCGLGRSGYCTLLLPEVSPPAHT